MTNSRPALTSSIRALLGSRRFFAVLVAVFVLEAAWLALSGRYPMAFDEDFHLGIIRLYAHHLSPFWSGQPANADAYGAVARDPSYLYQYLMSFPYRLVMLFTQSQTVIVMVLRGLNVALFAASLPLYRRLLLKTGASRALTQSCLALFVLIPIAPLLAAQINYDNLLLPLTALSLLLTVQISQELSQTQRLNVKRLLGLISLGLLTTLVKYAFLPVLLAVVVYLAARCWQVYPSWRKFWLSLGFGFTLMARRTRWLLLVMAVLSTALFAQRYGVNVVRYHTPIPDCSQVLSVQQCEAYGPWRRDHNTELHKNPNATKSPLVYAADWFYGMWLRTFFAVDGPHTNFQTRGPFVIPSMAAIGFTGVGLLAALAYSRRIFKKYNRPVLWLFAGTIISYAGLLWLDGYHSFLQIGVANAINGRYLLPILPLLLVICALGWQQLLRHRPQLKLAVASLALLCMLWGGGALTYILRSNDAWYWPWTPLKGANHAVQDSLGPLTPGYRDPGAFMGHN
ncbi:MAG TPA: hypothetical protein VHC21_03230 [Candidatus Saccharimonadales bacterium]|nr:hypothetical protein [Candidatus Saccharimonadales bacterium]